jgi:hypothetical protein
MDPGISALNSKIIKDKFSIPIIKELLDELCSAKFFTKLDLRSSYHQVPMNKDDIKKTPYELTKASLSS